MRSLKRELFEQKMTLNRNGVDAILWHGSHLSDMMLRSLRVSASVSSGLVLLSKFNNLVGD